MEKRMKAKLHFEVLADDGSLETESTVLWAKCDWNDVTFLQDLLVQTLDRSVEAGYTLAAGSGLTTPEQVKLSRTLARGEKVAVATTADAAPARK
jgi:hypothetical protein